jgi:GWxTD domain-containing protein
MMRANNLVFLLLVLFPSLGRALPDISMEVCRYQASDSPYIEVSIYVAGSSLTCKGGESQPYGISYILMIRDTDSSIVAGNRYRLTAVGCPAKDIIDVKRFNLRPGNFIVELEAYDIADTLGMITTSQHITIEANPSTVYISDLDLVSTVKPEQPNTPMLNKSGLYLEPLPFQLYYPALQTLYVYSEAYHIDQLAGQPYVQYTIKPMTGNSPAPILSFKKLKKEPVNANLFQLDISTLISGRYILEASIYDGDKQLKASASTTFSRINPKGDSLFLETASIDLENGFVTKIPTDSLDYYMRAMAPVLNSYDVDILNLLLDKGSEMAKRYFINHYWVESADKHADAAFASYMKVAKVVDYEYNSGFGFGFETDRGHVYMKYGKPDEIISVEDEPSAPPYEIWFYTTFPATHQENVRFLFYNPSLARNAYKLLHSTARGEVYNPLWEKELYRDATLETPGVNDTQMPANVYRNARQYFNN